MKYVMLFVLVILCIRSIYSILKDQTYDLITKRIKISNDYNIKIAHISDLHYGRFYNTRQLSKLINTLNNIEIDLIVITGDLIDDKYKGSLKGLMSFKTHLKEDVEKYIILGNHDYKSGRLNEYYSIVQQMGFKLLVNNNDKLTVNNQNVNIIGADDYLKGKRDLHKLEQLANNKFINILLLHEPDVVDKLNVNEFDLVLCGHSHGGQVRLPFNISGKTNLGRKYVDGYYKVSNCDVYVSSGIGMSGLPLRINVKPSITILEI